MTRKYITIRQAAALCMIVFLGLGAAWADTPPPEDVRSGSGWRQDTAGQWRGTGENFGRGWRTTKDGQIRGTGENFGRGWRTTKDGQIRGTGENFGRGWEPRGR
jgi:hypothetical protein